MDAHPKSARFCFALVTVCFAILFEFPTTIGHAEDDWQPGPANDPQTCRNLWEGIGLPRYRPNAAVNATLVCHTGFVLSHNDINKTPDWVIEHLNAAQISGTNTRPKGLKFRPEKNLPSAPATDNDYKNSTFDRGHQAPSEDFNSDEALMRETFVLSNAVPQVGAGFNQHIWAKLEQEIRDLFEDEGPTELYVVTGPVYQNPEGQTLTITANANACGNAIKLPPPKKASICDANNNNSRTPCGEAGVAVPAALYKIVFDPKREESNAFLMPNMDHRDAPGYSKTAAYINKFRTPVGIIEEYTGLQFFTAMQSRDRRRQIERCSRAMLR